MKRIRIAALLVAGLSLAWAILLFAIGGFEGQIFGIVVRTHDPVRLLWITVVALMTFALAGGRVVSVWLSAPFEFVRRHLRWAAIGLSVATFAIGLTFATMAIGGSDSYGYVSEADLWLAGRLKISQAWAADAPWPGAAANFTPLAYRPISDSDPWTIVPVYSPGLPLLMAGAKVVAGPRAMFFVVPFMGAMMVLATFGIGCRVGSPGLGFIGALFIATSPVFLFMLMQPMSDVAAAGFWTAAVYFLMGSRARSAAAAGLCASAAILVRPNLFPLVGVMGLWLGVRAWREDPAGRRRTIRQLAAFAACAAIGIGGTAAINQWVYGSPGTSGYGRLSAWFAWANILPNLRIYAHWFIEWQSPIALIGVAAILLPIRRIWPSVADRSALLLFGLVALTVFGEYLAFVPLDTWWALRLLLPCFPFIMLGLASALLAAVTSGRPAWSMAGACLLVFFAVRGLVSAADHAAFTAWKGDRRFPMAAVLARAETGDNSVFFSLMHTGSLRYYGGRMTIRFEGFDPAWFDRALAWFVARGVHPYALLDEWELKQMTERFAGQPAVSAFDAPPVFVYSQPSRVFLFDLLRPADSTLRTKTIVETFAGPRFVPPAPPPTLVFKE